MARKKETKTGELTVLEKLFQDPARFKKLKDGWVRDKLCGIEWGPTSTRCMDWEDANKNAADQGGRLPTVKELCSLIDYDKHNPAIDTNFFKDTKTDDWYWTGTQLASCSDDAWVVYFGNGGVGYGHKDNNNYVRPVRASQ